MNKTSIQWTDRSAQFFRARHKVTGRVGWHCVKKSTGCTHCYAETLNMRFGTKLPFAKRSESEVELFLDLGPLEKLRKYKKPQRVFLADMTDAFADFVPFDWLDQVFAMIAVTPQHTFQILTKRPERMAAYFADRTLGDVYTNVLRTEDNEKAFQPSLLGSARGIIRLTDSWEVRDGYTGHLQPPKAWPLPNLHLGASVENQEQANKRIPWLLKVPAAVSFLSVEPLLGPVKLPFEQRCCCGSKLDGSHDHYSCGPPIWDDGGISWVIVGGESGPHARPCNIYWIRDIGRQCREADVPVFVKQWGSRPFFDATGGSRYDDHTYHKLPDKKGGNPAEWPEDIRIREFPQIGADSCGRKTS
jgi:protein gp37